MSKRAIAPTTAPADELQRSPAVAPDDAFPYLRKKEAAALIHVSRPTLDKILRIDSTFPRFFEMSEGLGILLVSKSAVLAWLKRRELAERDGDVLAP